MRFVSLGCAVFATTLSVAAATAAAAAALSAPRHALPVLTQVVAGSTAIGPAALRYGRSLGSPTAGHLLGGARLTETDYLRIEPADTAGDVRWGLEPLVDMLDRAARAVRLRFPGTVTSVGHLSRAGGGDVERHRSHESGRDADIGFFVHAANGKQLLASHFVTFRADGTAPTWPGAFFDDAKNWTLVSSMISDPEAHVTHLFVAAPLRARLLDYAERAGAPPALRMRAAELMQQPHGVLPHDDHFHVRIGCPPHMNGCVENPTRVVRASAPLLARGHLAPASRALVTKAPKRPSQANQAKAVAHGARTTPSSGEPLRESAQPQGQPGPATLPVILPAPTPERVDDVDG